MLIGQASINLTANILSALLGLLSVFIFTRLFSPHDYGVYLLGVGFASVVSVFLVGWFRNLILSGHARNDGTDVRGLVDLGLCDLLPRRAGRLRTRPAGRAGSTTARWPRSRSSVAIGLFELTQDLVRARLMALSVMKATLVRAAAALGLGVVVALFSPTDSCCCCRRHLPTCSPSLVQSRTAWRGTVFKFDRPAVCAAAKQGLPLTLSLTLLAISTRHRPLHDRQSGRRRRCRQICRGPRPRPADADDAGDERRRGVLPARRADPCQPGRRRGAVASRRMPRVAAQHHAAGLPRLRRHFRPMSPMSCSAPISASWPRRPCRSSRSPCLPDPDPAISACQLPAVGTQLASI